MRLIADSGSTKTSWRAIKSDGDILCLETSGINPFFRSSSEIENELRENLLPVVPTAKSIYFYGSGIINAEKGRVVSSALQSIYGNIPIETHSDLLGAARSVCGDKPGIACILGTGSNACLYDGAKITDHIPPLGYILGDEGSGAFLGKQLLADYFKRVMPSGLQQRFYERFNINQNDVLERTYRQQKPNQYLAGFSPFLSENIEDPYCHMVIKSAFRLFLQRNVYSIPCAKEFPIHFVGSIASIFNTFLVEVIHEEGLALGSILKEPIDGLVLFHQK